MSEMSDYEKLKDRCYAYACSECFTIGKFRADSCSVCQKANINIDMRIYSNFCRRHGEIDFFHDDLTFIPTDIPTDEEKLYMLIEYPSLYAKLVKRIK